MKEIVLLRSNQIEGDSRVEKYLSFFKKNNLSYQCVGWDRAASGVELPNVSYYKRKTGYVVGGIKAAYNRLFWFVHVIRSLRRINPQFIHACDLDTAFPAALYKILYNRDAFLLFDVFDWMSDILPSHTNKMVRWATRKMEYIALKQANKLIICEEERKAQIPNSEKYDIWVLPNIPMISESYDVKFDKAQYKFSNKKLTLSYVGWFGHGRFLDELLDAAEEGKFNLLIAGYGNHEIEQKCEKLADKSNIRYFGRLPYNEGLNLMYNSDIIFAMYCKIVPNHYYAAPNKYYEAMFLGKPIITTKGIIVGDKVAKDNIGYVIEENMSAFISLIDNINSEDIVIKGNNASYLWETKYNIYTQSFLDKKYMSLIQ